MTLNLSMMSLCAMLEVSATVDDEAAALAGWGGATVLETAVADEDVRSARVGLGCAGVRCAGEARDARFVSLRFSRMRKSSESTDGVEKLGPKKSLQKECSAVFTVGWVVFSSARSG